MQKIVKNLGHPAAWSKGDKIRMNKPFEDLVGCEKGQISTLKEYFRLIHNEESDFYENVFLKKLEENTSNILELHGKKLDSEEITIRYTFYKENDMIIWIAVDDTCGHAKKNQDTFVELYNLKKTLIVENRKLKKSEKKYRLLYTNTENPVIEIDQEFNVLSLNDAFKKTFKYLNTNILEVNETLKLWQILNAPDLENKLKNSFNNTTPKQNFQTFRVYTSRNKERIVQLRIYAIKNQNRTFTYQVILHDLTEKVKKYNERFKHENLELMEKMAQIVAHEVRNPLNNIILAQSQIKNNSTPKISPFIDIIERNANRIEFLISRFLETFKRSELVLNKIGINDIARNCFESFKDKAQLTGAELELITLEDDVELLIDEEGLELALNNLINNAIQACEEEEEKKVRIQLKQNKKGVGISVRDTGKGLCVNFKQRIFDPFFSNKKSGLGLGLTTSLRIVEAHNGKIDFKNNKEKGATFTILLPLI